MLVWLCGMLLYYSADYSASDFEIETSRKAAWIAESLRSDAIDGVELIAPVSLTNDQILEVHDAQYIAAIKTGEPKSLSESQGFAWDSKLWRMVTASNGGAVSAALQAMKHGIAGSLSSGMHHAQRDRGAAFCTFNGLALAVRAALGAGANRVLILDVDAHCGGGTARCLAELENVWQVDISTCRFDSYEYSERFHLEVIDRADNYLPCVEHHLDELDRQGIEFGLCMYNAGMDAHEDCETGGLAGVPRKMLSRREEMVFEWCCERGLPTAFVIAGGYIGPRLGRQELVDLHRYTVRAAASSATHVGEA